MCISASKEPPAKVLRQNMEREIQKHGERQRNRSSQESDLRKMRRIGSRLTEGDVGKITGESKIPKSGNCLLLFQPVCTLHTRKYLPKICH